MKGSNSKGGWLVGCLSCLLKSRFCAGVVGFRSAYINGVPWEVVPVAMTVLYMNECIQIQTIEKWNND